MAYRELAGKRCARTRGLSKSGGVEHDAFFVAAIHREMSLGTHGDDREIDRAQHLFCHGAEQQLAQLAAASCTEEQAACMELAGRGSNLLGGFALANQGIASDVPRRARAHQGLQGFGGEIQGGGWIVIGQSGNIEGHG